MNYEEARVYLEQASKYGSVLGLESMKGLLDKLDNPQDQLRFIHIAGTNGKGSVLAYLSTILQKAGYRIGRYISPTLFSYRERIQVNGQRIEKDALARHITVIARAVEEIKRRQEPIPTVFEIETALAFLYFKEKKCDIAVVETGLGGALDATNVIKTTLLEVIAPIGLDHMDVLGKTLGEIAAQKAGIIKEGTRVVTAAQEPEAREVLERVCREKNCRLRQVEPQKLKDIHYGWDQQSFSYKQWENVQISLAGKFQIQNAALALEAAEQLREESFDLPDTAVYEGMRETCWRGRFTVVSREPVVILDGAHNPQAARALKNSLEQYFSGKKLYYVFGVFRDKDYKKIIELTAPAAEHIITVETPDNPRALPAEELREEVKRLNPAVESADSVESAVEKSLRLMNPEDVLVIFGSLSFLSLADKAIKKGEKLHG
ncbi:MAG TPA: bifunctional folylpolyglutamate synthase/dihydrofolate synthase [Candidatus Egerieimonas intestinavium]|uniref:tetrahydrofolate synthase n=1 Tax=Candidatus Egerieimonas intestinavium TaxID=2840777 RepID=A0A9D1JGC3_9FIRM|nr:bifunctional folylpolyglutamate synthase/dihydrofolate synthase [Candidatus Egerieimonas intestinavium]